MTLRILVSLLFVSIFGIGWVGLSYAQDDVDREYAQMIEKDSRSIGKGDPLFQVGESIRDDKLDKKSVKMARKTLDDYIASLESYDVHWKWKHPKPLGNPIPYYTDDESAPITYEWKIQCDDTRDCGSVIITTIDTESRIMEAGTYGTANYERLVDGKVSQKNRLYYYSPFDQYIERDDGKTTTVDMIDPEKQSKQSSEERISLLKSEKESRKEMRKGGKILFDKSETIPMSTFSSWTPSFSKTTATSLASSSSTMVDVLHMPATPGCSSALPCYQQFRQTYGSSVNCASGCSPNAMTIIFGYYDRMNIFPNLFPWVMASDVSVDQNIENTVRTYMQTACSGAVNGEWNTTPWVIRFGLQYAQTHGYPNTPLGTYSFSSLSVLMAWVITEINWARPLVVNFQNATYGHSLVAYGYNSTGNSSTDQLHVSYGWGNVYPDKYVSISNMVWDPTNPASSLNKLVWAKLVSTITVPVRN